MKPDLQAIRERAEKATAGPWIYMRNLLGIFAENIAKSNLLFSFLFYKDQGAQASVYDAEFVAHARADIPAMLEYISDLEAVAESVKELEIIHKCEDTHEEISRRENLFDALYRLGGDKHET